MNDADKTREQLIKELEEQALKYRMVHDTAFDAILLADVGGKIIESNPSAEEIFGYTPGEMAGMDLIDIIPEEYREAHRMGFRRFIETGRASIHGKVLKLKGLKKDGTVFPCELVVNSFAVGNNLFFSGTVRDISERTRADEALRESEEKFRNLFENSNDAIFIHDLDGRIISVNRRALDLFGYTESEVRGLSVAEFHPPEAHDDFVRAFAMIKKHGFIKMEMEFRKKGGEVFPAEVSSSLSTLGEGTVVHGIVRDMSERRRIEAELAKIERLESLGLLAGGIAHDFNNLLARLMGDITFLEGNLDSSSDAATRMREAQSTIIEARGLTRQLLTFARGGAPVKKTVDTRGLVTSAVGFALRGSNLKCEYSFAPDLEPVEVDEGQINQVIANLVINASHAMSGGGTIEVEVRGETIGPDGAVSLKDGRYVRVSVTDHGSGIKKQDLCRVFDPFFTTKETGKGLGLSTAYSIIKKHGGQISVKSEPGAGTTFTFHLPVSEKKAAESRKEKVVPVAGDARVLLMDDEDDIRELSCLLLGRLGYRTEGARDGADAIERYRAATEAGEPFDLVILDLTVPGGMGGREAVDELKKIDPEVKAIVASGYSDDPVLAEFRKFGFRGIVSKPYSVTDLTRAINETLNHCR